MVKKSAKGKPRANAQHKTPQGRAGRRLSQPNQKRKPVEAAVKTPSSNREEAAAPPISRRDRQGAASSQPLEVAGEARHRLIQDAAYFIAEGRGFTPGNERTDWLEAEFIIDRLLSGKPSSTVACS